MVVVVRRSSVPELCSLESVCLPPYSVPGENCDSAAAFFSAFFAIFQKTAFSAIFELFCCTTRTHSALFGQQRLIVAVFYSNMTSAYTRDL